MKRAIPLFLALFVLVGCASTADLAPGNGGRVATIAGKTYDQVWEAAIRGIQNSKEDRLLEWSRKPYIVSQDKQAGRIVAETGMAAFSWGEVIGVYISPTHDAPEYKVEVQNMRKVGGNIAAKDWDVTVLANIKKELNQ